eukprot:1601178-Amphidinium_carterae.1
MEAVTERLMWLLYLKFVHYCFTFPTYRIFAAQLADNHLTLPASDVVLRFAWLVVAVFGSSLP